MGSFSCVGVTMDTPAGEQPFTTSSLTKTNWTNWKAEKKFKLFFDVRKQQLQQQLHLREHMITTRDGLYLQAVFFLPFFFNFINFFFFLCLVQFFWTWWKIVFFFFSIFFGLNCDYYQCRNILLRRIVVESRWWLVVTFKYK